MSLKNSVDYTQPRKESVTSKKCQQRIPKCKSNEKMIEGEEIQNNQQVGGILK